MDDLDVNAATKLFQLRLLIARAAQKDSLGWWDDQTLTPEGGYVLERLFPGAPLRTGMSFALEAALARHRAALPDLYPQARAIHLYAIDSDRTDQLAWRVIKRRQTRLFLEPIPDVETLRQLLTGITGAPARYRITGRIGLRGGLRIEDPGRADAMIARAEALAWAYLESKPGHPIFPYIAEPIS